jgi:hypothetical protein
VAFSGPFQLFSEDCIQHMRRELLGKPVPGREFEEALGKHICGLVPE